MRLSQRAFFLFYRFLLWPALRCGFVLLSLFNGKIREGLNMRRGSPWLGWSRDQKPIWFHCASGELEYAKPVIDRLKRASPETKILVTYFSPSIAKAARSYPGVDFACPSPWERPEDLSAFIEWHRPRALAIARTDTWPEMLRQAKLAGLPTILFSATLPESSGRARGFGRWLSRAAFSLLDHVLCVSEEDRRVFEAIGVGGELRVGGDTRYDQVFQRLAHPKPVRAELFNETDARPVLVAGSTWEEDEAVLIPCASELRGHLRWVIVPHEPTPTHLAKLEVQLRESGLTFTRYSSASAWSSEDVLIVDKIGILAELYSFGRFAFVGGSFKKSVHSVMEPLAAGCLTFVGPFHVNNREALEFRSLQAPGKDATCVSAVANHAELAKLLRGHLGSEFSEGSVRKGISREVESRAGRSDAVSELCLKVALKS